ncbi:hypothetical protein TNCV_1367241 [Trichonephila clavipes]|nr:hypothetical protein TNCV_1367241 [Trichonephila clavipes]
MPAMVGYLNHWATAAPSTQAEYSRFVRMKNSTSTQVERSFQKMAARLLHGRFFCSLVPNFDQNPGRAPIICVVDVLGLKKMGVPPEDEVEAMKYIELLVAKVSELIQIHH